MLSPSDFIAQVSLRGMLHCKPEIVGDHPCSGDYTLIHHCNLNNDFIQKKEKKAVVLVVAWSEAAAVLVMAWPKAAAVLMVAWPEAAAALMLAWPEATAVMFAWL